MVRPSRSWQWEEATFLPGPEGRMVEVVSPEMTPSTLKWRAACRSWNNKGATTPASDVSWSTEEGGNWHPPFPHWPVSRKGLCWTADEGNWPWHLHRSLLVIQSRVWNGSEGKQAEKAHIVHLCIFNDVYPWTVRPLQAETTSETPVCPRTMSSCAFLWARKRNKLEKKDAFMNE